MSGAHLPRSRKSPDPRLAKEGERKFPQQSTRALVLIMPQSEELQTCRTSCVLQGVHARSNERLIGGIQSCLWRDKYHDPVASARERHPVALQPHLMGVMGVRPGLRQALPAISSPQKIFTPSDDRKV